MENAIKTLRIQNFKSIKDVTINPRRVNLIIGMPNVGKSNILEAMSLLGAGLYDEGQKFLSNILRYETISNLFYDNEISQPIIIESSNSKAGLKFNDNGNVSYRFIQTSKTFLEYYINESNILRKSYGDSNDELDNFFWHMSQESFAMKMANKDASLSYIECNVQADGLTNGRKEIITNAGVMPRKYLYKAGETHSSIYRYSFLKPPFGHNLLEVIQNSKITRKEIVNLFKPYGLNMVLRIGERKFEIQKNVDDFVYNYPYSLIADTLQRIIFYLAAIESNDDSVMLFEEPEAHTFPVYTSMLGRKIAESHNNQFFIATHSPYLVTEIMEQLLPEEGQEGELAIFLAYYEDYQTKVKQLSDEEVREIRNDSIDVFYNLSRFTPGSNSYA